MSGGQPILSVRDLSVSIRTDGVWRPAVEALSFEVGPRETVALVGESGSGKSVTALSVMRLLPPAKELFASTGVTCSRSRRGRCAAFAAPSPR